MKVGLVGFGNTGTAVATVLLKNPQVSLEWVLRQSTRHATRTAPDVLGIDSTSPGRILCARQISADSLLDEHPVDVIIDFSSEDGLDYYGEAAATRHINIVSALSHYSLAKQRKLERLSRRTAILWSPNITVGINFLILAAQTLRRIAPGTDVEIIEEHFKDKRSVSGTAKIISASLGVEEQAIKSIRAGAIIGVHEILFGMPNQTIRLRHESVSREAFGSGAMFVAERLEGKPPGLYKMEDLLLPFFGTETWAPTPTWRERIFRVGSRSSARDRRRAQMEAAIEALHHPAAANLVVDDVVSERLNSRADPTH
ncbi:MAG TPA: dihydrodipicolinate reductase C-terminal domain-containing protein [Acidimicrobiales bacterium]|nr:dihydrodipicolinate reductase C-terminal domain-containing protein [Acidimicrobiales bacterium]